MLKLYNKAQTLPTDVDAKLGADVVYTADAALAADDAADDANDADAVAAVSAHLMGTFVHMGFC